MKKKILCTISMTFAMTCMFSTQVFAISEDEVQAIVDSVGKEAVTGNVFIWFLCAIAFLKISQKIDSFMSSLGINVGHTGGSMLAEAMIAARGVSTMTGKGGGGFRGGSGGGSKGASAAAGFMSGGLAGAVGRQATNSAIKSQTEANSSSIASKLGGKAFSSSVEKGGSFASNVTGTVAKGSMNDVGSMTGPNASRSLQSYMGYAGMDGGDDVPSYSGVEIGGGRMTGTETNSDNPSGIAFGMYSMDQYSAPEGTYTTETSLDGSQWYKQYATDTVDKSPYMAPDGSIAYNESIVKKLPNSPRRKDRI